MVTFRSLSYFAFTLAASVVGRPIDDPSITDASSSSNVCSSLGCAQGVAAGGAVRFSLPYALPPLGDLRFANPQPVGKFNTSVYDATQQPRACMQYDDDDRGISDPEVEDCLYLNVFKPAKSTSSSKLPVMFWVHGGSFIGGSATAVGLDGTKLASTFNVVVVIVQYRLGVFGFLQTSSTLNETAGAPGASTVAGNQAVRDVELALKYVSTNIGAYGGDASNVMLFGQSSGAHMIRTLLTVPSADKYFAKALLASDTSDYGLAPAKQMNAIGKRTLAYVNCTTIACARKVSARDLLAGSFDTYNKYPLTDASCPDGEVFRPTKGSYIPSALESDAAAGKGIKKPVIITTVLNEAGHLIGTLFARTPPKATTLTSQGISASLSFWAEQIFTTRGSALGGSSAYSRNASQDDALREEFENITTDGLWRCGNQFNARNLAAGAGGADVFLGAFNAGIPYPSNTGVDYCVDKVCHEDDILAIFGTYGSNATAAQVALSAEVQARYVAFARTSDPNAKGLATWSPVSSGEQLNLLRFGARSDGSSASYATQNAAACGPKGIWGQSVKFDWQLYA